MSKERPEVPPDSTNAAPGVDFYGSTYSRFDQAIYHDIRRETWGEDFGQNGWITAPEQDRFIGLLQLAPGRRLLDIACGSGGPTLRMARRSGATVVGVDIHADGIAAANRQAAAQQLEQAATFQTADAGRPIPMPDASFDAVVCIDAINHLADREATLRDWARLLMPGGRVLFTDPVVVTGPVTSAEIAIRSSIGQFVYVAPETNERALHAARLSLLAKEDLTEALARTASDWHAARARRTDELRRIEGDATFEGQQRFLETAARLAAERRLSRFMYVACASSA